jgi:hypothetical protein
MAICKPINVNKNKQSSSRIQDKNNSKISNYSSGSVRESGRSNRSELEL